MQISVISDRMKELLFYRIQQEELSGRIYKAMHEWLNWKGYVNSAKLWEKYSSEEFSHAEKVYDYLSDLDILPPVPAIEETSRDFDEGGLPLIIEITIQHELEVTRQCAELTQACYDENDYLTLQLANFFMSEQREELGKVTLLQNLLNVYGSDSKLALAMLDEALGEYV